MPPEQLVFVRWPGGEEVAELVPTGATAPKVNTKRRDLDSKSLADLVEISLKDVEKKKKSESDCFYFVW